LKAFIASFFANCPALRPLHTPRGEIFQQKPSEKRERERSSVGFTFFHFSLLLNSRRMVTKEQQDRKKKEKRKEKEHAPGMTGWASARLAMGGIWEEGTITGRKRWRKKGERAEKESFTEKQKEKKKKKKLD